MNEQALIRDLRKRKSAALETLMHQYGRLVWTVAAGILSGVGTAQDVEEIVSDVFVELWDKPEQFAPDRGGLKAFLCLKAKTRAIDRLRQLRRTAEVPLECEPETADLQQELLTGDAVREVQRLLAQLQPPDREILTLRLLYEVKPADIARKLSLPVSQVYERIRRGKARLAAALRQEGYDE